MQAVLDHLPDFVQRIKNVAVQYFGSLSLVESLDIGVLRGLARLNMLEGNVF